jgi:hypothetical protein
MKYFELEQRHYYGLLGLSEPMDTEEGLPYKLNTTEKKCCIDETCINANIQRAAEEALDYFKKSFDNGKVYFRSSRWNTGKKMHCLEYKKVLNKLVGDTLTEEINV